MVTLVFGTGTDNKPAVLPRMQQPMARNERQSEKEGNPYLLFIKLTHTDGKD